MIISGPAAESCRVGDAIVAGLFVVTGLALGLVIEYAEAVGGHSMYSGTLAAGIYLAAAIMIAMTFRALRDETQLPQLMDWCKDESPATETEESLDICRMCTGIKCSPMMSILLTSLSGSVVCIVMMSVLPSSNALTAGRMGIQYDILMILLMAPLVEMRYGGMNYTRGQKMAVVTTAMTIFVALSACPCSITLSAEQLPYYDDPMDMEDYAFLTAPLLLGLFLRWLSCVALVVLLGYVHSCMNALAHNSVAKCFYSSVFLCTAAIMATLIAINDDESFPEPSWYPLTYVLLLIPYLVSALLVLAWRGVYFLTVITAFQVAVRLFFDVVCTPYSLSIYAICLLLAAWYQYAFWRKEPCDARKMRDMRPQDTREQMEDIEGYIIMEDVNIEVHREASKDA